MAKTFLSIAVLILTLIIGAYLWRHFVEKPRITTKIVWYEKPLIMPVKVESKVGKQSPPTPEAAKRDTIFLDAPCDSLRAWAMEKIKPFDTTFEDTTAFADSTVSFFAREITTIEADPWTRIITKARRFEDAYLRVARVETTEETSRIDWLVTLGAFVLGILTALLMVR